jgi:hypothetical protein
MGNLLITLGKIDRAHYIKKTIKIFMSKNLDKNLCTHKLTTIIQNKKNITREITATSLKMRNEILRLKKIIEVNLKIKKSNFIMDLNMIV